MDKHSPRQGIATQNTEIARKVQAAEQASLRRQDSTTATSPVRAAVTERKLKRAQGIAETTPAPQPGNERKALENTERANRLKAGSSPYREALIRIGMGDVDTATVLIVGFSFLAMLVIPVAFIVTS